MITLLELAASNVAMASLLALAAATVGRYCRRPALTHALWLLVLVKLVTPPLVPIHVPALELMATRQAAFVQQEPVELQAQLVVPDVNVEVPLDNTDVPAPKPRSEVWAEESAPSDPDSPEQRKPLLIEEAQDVPAPAAAEVNKSAEVTEVAAFNWPLLLETLTAAWLLGSSLWLILAGRRVHHFQHLLRHGRLAAADIQDECRRLAERLRVRSPEVWLVPGVLSPLIWVIGRSRRLLVPQDLLRRLSGEQLTTLFAHELAHLRRGDPWVRHLEFVVLAFYWWCPLAWWARRELREAEEECCDAWVLWALPGSARAYALALVETVDFMAEAQPPLPVLASGLGPVQSLRRRLIMIMRGTPPRTMTAAGVLIVLALGGLLPLLPTWAQEPTAREDNNRLSPQDSQSRDEVKHLQQMIDALRKNIDKMQRDLHDKQIALEALRRKQIKQAEREALKAHERALERVRENYVVFPPGGQKGNTADLERRLADLERKLVETLRELQALRRQLGQSSMLPAPAVPPPVYQLPVPGQPRPEPPFLGYVMPLNKPQ